MDLGALSEAQALARGGVLAQALAAWVRYLAGGLEARQAFLRKRVEELRPHYPFPHGRTTDAAARLHAVFELLREYWAALDLRVEAEPVLEALRLAASRQEEYQRDADAVDQVLAILASSFATGKAHLRSTDGGEPPEPQRWGWVEDALGRKPQGEHIGWIRDGEPVIYLNREAFYRRVAQEAWAQGIPLPSPRTLLKLMAQRGALRTEMEGGKVRFDTKVSVAGVRVRAIAIPLYVVESGASGAGARNALLDEANPRPTNLGCPTSSGAGSAVPDGCPTPSGAGGKSGAGVFAVRDANNGGCPTRPTFADIMGVEDAQPGNWEGWGEIPDPEEVGE